MNYKFWLMGLIVLIALNACGPTSSLEIEVVEDQEVLQQGSLAGTPEEICNTVTVPDVGRQQYEQAEQVLETNIDYRALLCTEVGSIYIDLFETFTPITVNNFVFLAERGFYNDTTFHRVLDGFMAQGGDPTGTGTGTPGYRFEDEFVGFLHFDRPGLLAMANSGQPRTNGSQFFITTSMPSYLNYRHTIFGQVIEGMDVVRSLRLRDPQQSPEFSGTTLQTVLIITNKDAVDTDEGRLERPNIDEIRNSIESIDALPGLEAFNQVNTGIIDASLLDELDQFEFEFGVEVVHASQTCDTTDIPFVETGFQMFVFATADDAEQAMMSNEMRAIAPRNKTLEYDVVESDFLSNPLQIAATNACSEPASQAVTYWRRGRYILVVDAIIIGNEVEQADLWLEQVVGWRIYENLLTDILRAEIGWVN